MQIGIPLSIGFDPGSQIHLDSRYDNNGVPYTSTQQVLDLLPIYKRKQYLPVNINGVDYWFDTVSVNHLVPKNIIEITSVGGSVDITKTINGYDLEVIKAELELYASNEAELITAWQTAINSGKVAKIWITGNITFTANRLFIQGYGLPGIKLEATQQRDFNFQSYIVDFNNLTFTNITFRTSGSFYLRLVGGLGNFYNCGWIDDVNDTTTYKKNIIIVGPITMGTAKIVIKQLTHFTQTSFDNVNNLIQPFIIENQATFSNGNLYVEILEMAAVAEFNRFSRVMLTSTVSNCPYNVTGDESWFYVTQQPLPSTVEIPTNIASYANILKYASIDNLKALRLKLDNTGTSILGLDINGNIVKIDKSTVLTPKLILTSIDDTINITPNLVGYDIVTTNVQNINIGASLQTGFGLYYNGYTVRKPFIDSNSVTNGYAIANVGFHPSNQSDWDDLIIKCGGLTHASTKLKQVGNVTWQPYTSDVDSDLFGFTALGSGIRDGSTGDYKKDRQWEAWWVANMLGSVLDNKVYCVDYIYTDLRMPSWGITSGLSIRLVKDFTTLTIQGQKGEYIGNDGKKYITILIGTREWLTSDLAETKWRDGTLIHAESNDSIWVSITSPSVCAWLNNWNYIVSGDKLTTIDKNNVLSFKGGSGINVSSNIIPGKVEVIISSTGVGGAGGVTSYNDLTDKPTIPDITNLVVKDGVKILSDQNYTLLEKNIVGNQSGINSGDNAINNLYSGLITSKEDIGIAASLIFNLKNGVSSAGDTLKKLYDLIVSSYKEQTVANIAARDAYNIDHLPFNIFVLDDGDGKWALYKAITIGIGATFVKLSDPDLLNTVMSATQIQTAYEGISGVNRFTNAYKTQLDSITAIFTTILKTAYDTASTWIITNGVNVLNHIGITTGNPHGTTKSDIGLGNVPNLIFSGSNTGDQTLPTVATLGAEVISNKVTSISGASTNIQYPSAKLLFDQLATKQPTGTYLVAADITGKENTSAKDASSGYAGMTLFKYNFKNLLNTITSFWVNSATISRTYTFPDKDITIAGLSDIPSVTNMEVTTNKDTSNGYAGITLFKYNFRNLLNTFTSFTVNSNTTVRTYTFPDKDGIIAMTGDLVGSSLQNRLCQIVTGRTAIVAGTAKGSAFITAETTNSRLTRIECYLTTAGTTATTINIRKNAAGYALSTVCTIPANVKTSTGATAYVIDATYSLGVTDDEFSVEIVSAGTNAAGLTVVLTFTKQ